MPVLKSILPIADRRPPPRSLTILQAKAQAQVNHLASSPVPKGLTRRESEILPWLATDLSYAEIALRFGYSQHFARMLAQRLFRKLDVNSRPAAVARWLRPDAFSGEVSKRPP